MWVVGTFLLLIAGAAVCVALGWKPRTVPSARLWDLPGLGGTYTGIVGTLAGFAVASATFIAGLDYPRQSPEFSAVIGMLLIAFVVLMATAMMYGTTPSVDDPGGDADETIQALSNVLANGSYFLGLSLSWLALRPLLVMLELTILATAFTWLLLSLMVSGCVRLALFSYRLLAVGGLACLAIPLVGLGLPAIYWFMADRVWSWLWPSSNATLPFAFVAFAVASLGFALQSGLLFIHGVTRAQLMLRRDGHRVGLAYTQAIAITVGLVWFAVATS